MKYHGYTIKKVAADLGESGPRLNFIYEIYKDGEWKNNALVLNSAKEYIDSGEDDNYL